MREQRKVVTVLFADVVGSTQLASQSDPEVVRARMRGYFDRVTEIARTHGGTTEKFAGDAAMVVFGVPTAHDDDAERAVRAALEIRNAVTQFEVRIGINTGEAVTAMREDRQQMVSGDTVNIAARLQQGADPGEIVAGALTERLTRAAIEYAPREPMVVKGKADPLAAFRAVRPRSPVPAQARGVPGLHSALVGRERELRLLVDTYSRVAAERRLHLFTLIGDPGVGKSRLVDEALATIGGLGGRLVRGRCLPYGQGITYWPLIEILRQDTDIALGDDRSAALAKLDRWLGELLPGDPDLPALRARLSVMLGLEPPAVAMSDTPADRIQREIGWGVRKYIAAVCGSAPVVVVIDDVQWAEPPLVEILEQLADRLSGVPAMLICVARPEFLQQYPAWSLGKANTTTMSLEPLSPGETGELIAQLLDIEVLPAGLRTQIVERSAGTPLFCEEIIRMLVDDGRLVRDGDHWRATAAVEQIPVPPSISAILSARLDGLPEGDRAVLQAASVIGQRFTSGQVTALFAGADIDGYLDSLRRKGLIGGEDRPDSEMWFSHLLVRDAAYGSLTKAERASLHDRFGSILESEVHDAEQASELLAHHAATAFSLSVELGLDRATAESRARRALRWALELAERAGGRHDRTVLESALNIARSAADALPDGGGPGPRARLSLVEARRGIIIADYASAARHAVEAAAVAESAGLDALVASARLAEAWIWTWAGEGAQDEYKEVLQRAIAACEKAGDDERTIEARFIATNVFWSEGRLSDYVLANRGLAAEAQAMGDRRRAAAILMRIARAEAERGNAAAAASVQTEVAQIAGELGLRDLLLRLQLQKAELAWWRGDRDRGEALMRRYVADAVEAGAGQLVLLGLRFLATMLVTGKQFEKAVPVLEQAIEMSRSSGDRWNRSELYALRAEAALGSGDLDSADRFIGDAVQTVRNEEDVSAVAVVYRTLGLVRTAQDRLREAENALRKAHMVAAPTEYLRDRIAADLALAAFVERQDGGSEARALVDSAKEMCRRGDWHMWDADIEQIERQLEVGA